MTDEDLSTEDRTILLIGSGPIQIVFEQTNEFGNASDREEIRQMVREATRNGGEDALAELELLLKQTLSEA